MKLHQTRFSTQTNGRNTYNITPNIEQIIAESKSIESAPFDFRQQTSKQGFSKVI